MSRKRRFSFIGHTKLQCIWDRGERVFYNLGARLLYLSFVASLPIGNIFYSDSTDNMCLGFRPWIETPIIFAVIVVAVGLLSYGVCEWQNDGLSIAAIGIVTVLLSNLMRAFALGDVELPFAAMSLVHGALAGAMFFEGTRPILPKKVNKTVYVANRRVIAQLTLTAFALVIGGVILSVAPAVKSKDGLTNFAFLAIPLGISFSTVLVMQVLRMFRVEQCTTNVTTEVGS